MSDNSGIEWTDATWNPVTGCTKVSPGCDHCYAETFVERFRGVPGHHFERGFDLTLRPERLITPLTWKRPRRIFVNSMSDLFHDGVPDEFIAKVFAVMVAARRHTFQLLTKRHARMRALLSSPRFESMVVGATMANEIRSRTDYYQEWAWPAPNVWLGVSVENQQWADIRIPALQDTPAAVRFLSCEPLVGPVGLYRWLRPADSETWLPRIHWIICGGESGPGARPMHPDWARSLRDQCVAAGVPFLFKQWGEWTPRDHHAGHYSRGVWLYNDGSTSTGVLSEPSRPDPRAAMFRVGKKRAGRVLDGRTWDEFPTRTTEVA